MGFCRGAESLTAHSLSLAPLSNPSVWIIPPRENRCFPGPFLFESRDTKEKTGNKSCFFFCVGVPRFELGLNPPKGLVLAVALHPDFLFNFQPPCRAAENRTRTLPTPWADTTTILQPALLSECRDSNPESHEPESWMLPLHYTPNISAFICYHKKLAN